MIMHRCVPKVNVRYIAPTQTRFGIVASYAATSPQNQEKKTWGTFVFFCESCSKALVPPCFRSQPSSGSFKCACWIFIHITPDSSRNRNFACTSLLPKFMCLIYVQQIVSYQNVRFIAARPKCSRKQKLF